MREGHRESMGDLGPVAILRTVGDYRDPIFKVDRLAFLAANPMSDRQMIVFDVPPKGPSTFVRRLTPREYERIQGLPDDWTRWTHDGREISDTVRYRMLGNSVAVPLIEWIARRLMIVDALLRERR